MSVAIIIGAHGLVAKQLLKTVEMILGKQTNAAWIDFVPGENTETLLEKYTAHLAELNTMVGVLFLVDTWGGSPFNAASRIAIDKKNHEVITGVNVPMLVEIFMTRDINPNFHDLVKVAIETGRIGVRALKTTELKQNIYTATSLVNNYDGHMTIGLARIDDRLIHGQIVTCWIKATNVKRIIIVSDEVDADTVRKTLLTQVVPPGIKAHVVNVEKAIRVYNNPKYSHDRVMLLFTNPTDVLRLVEGGVTITSVNVGGMAFRHGKIQVNNAVSVDAKDIEAFKKLSEHGIELEVRKVFNDSKLKMMNLIEKLNS